MSQKSKIAAKTPESKKGDSGSKLPKSNFPQSLNSPVVQISFLQKSAVNQAVQKLVKSGWDHPKFKIGQHNDTYEQEADRISECVLHTPEVEVPNQIDSLNFSSQTRGSTKKTPQVSSNTISRIQALKGGGQPLPNSARAFFEPRFGHDFRHVRVHADSNASDVAKSLNARAFTLGKDVVFGSGGYQPQSKEGKRLLAHELTHVVQQSQDRSTGSIVMRDVEGDEASSVGQVELEAVMEAVGKAAKWLLAQIGAMHGSRAFEVEVIVEGDIYAFWSRALGGADELAREVTYHLDQATQSAFEASKLAHANDKSVEATDRAIQHLLDAKRSFAAARAATADERAATVKGAQLAIVACEATIDALMMATGMAAGARYASTKLGAVGIDAAVRFVLSAGSTAATQHQSGQEIDVTGVILSGISSAVSAGAGGLVPLKMEKLFPGMNVLVRGAISGAAAQTIEEVWAHIAAAISGKDAPSIANSLAKIAVGTVAGLIGAKLEQRGLMPPAPDDPPALKLDVEPEDILQKLEMLGVLKDIHQQQQTAHAIYNAAAKYAENSANLIDVAAKELERTPAGPQGAVGVASKVAELRYAIAAYEATQRPGGRGPSVPPPRVWRGSTTFVQVGDPASSGPRGQALLEKIDHAIHNQPHEHYELLPLADLRQLATLTGWIDLAEYILYLARETHATGVHLRTKWNVSLFAKVIEDSARLIERSKLNNWKDVAVLNPEGVEGVPVRKATVRAALEPLRKHYQRIPRELGGPGGGA